jgi:tetratricopeptide (TPR) repeat protein
VSIKTVLAESLLNAMYDDTLKLICSVTARFPLARLPHRLAELFRRLARTMDADEADALQDMVWACWMQHGEERAVNGLEQATRAIVAHDYSVAERMLKRLAAVYPELPEVWNKQATLYYMQGAEEPCVQAIHRTLRLEPRHFGAICGFAEILLARGERAQALFAFDIALRVNPHLAMVRVETGKLIRERPELAH